MTTSLNEAWPVFDKNDFEKFEFKFFSSAATYHMMTAMILPRPIAFVTTLSQSKVLNLAPFSFFNGVCANPPIISISIGRREGRYKDTVRNILQQEEFVLNFSTLSIKEGVEQAAADFLPEESELEAINMETFPSQVLKTPCLAHSPLHMECRLHKHLEIGQGPTDMILGEIICANVHKKMLDDKGRIRFKSLNPLARLAAGYYSELGPKLSNSLGGGHK